ncbi:MAG: HlyD family efflux transporter periplasmic adaptor subunit [Rhodovarius sp.]|nr:HlyD family secretion protein [Rhodovarius sp.]MDW8316115.1 HlyD family efflux transporter periplasmic adaptor subunit [Rhodovarius sp.]
MKRLLAAFGGLLLAAVGLYVIVGEQMAGITSNAMVNAQVMIVRAPVEGVLQLHVRRLGARLAPGQVIGSLNDPRPDDSRLLELQRTIAVLQADRERLRDLAEVLETSRRAYAAQAEAYGAGRVSQLQARLAEAQALKDAARARLLEADAALRRASELARAGVQTVADITRIRTAQEVAAQEVEAMRNRIHFLNIELDAARRGVFLGDSYNDAPSSQQRLRELEQRQGELATELAERDQRLALLEAQLQEERARLARFSGAVLTATSPSILWEIMTADGEYVRRAQDLVRLVDCSTTMVTASVREGVYNRLRVGDPAQFRLAGDGRVFDAVVTRLAGSGAATVYRSLAVGPSEEHLKRFDVLLSVPALAQDPELSCAIGRTGRAVFSSRPLDFLRRLTLGLF